MATLQSSMCRDILILLCSQNAIYVVFENVEISFEVFLGIPVRQSSIS